MQKRTAFPPSKTLNLSSPKNSPGILAYKESLLIKNYNNQTLAQRNGPHPQYGWDLPEEVPEKTGKTPETHSEHILEFPSRARLGLRACHGTPSSTGGISELSGMQEREKREREREERGRERGAGPGREKTEERTKDMSCSKPHLPATTPVVLQGKRTEGKNKDPSRPQEKKGGRRRKRREDEPDPETAAPESRERLYSDK